MEKKDSHSMEKKVFHSMEKKDSHQVQKHSDQVWEGIKMAMPGCRAWRARGKGAKGS